MRPSLMTLRVRPARVVVLINKEAPLDKLIETFRFFSQLWGGRYGVILPVSRTAADPLSEFRLGELRPEIVYLVDVDESIWKEPVTRSCQPRWIALLTPDIAADIRNAHFEGFIRGDRAVIAMFNARSERSPFNRSLTIVAPSEDGSLRAYYSAAFGVHPPDLLPEYRDAEVQVGAEAAHEIIDVINAFASDRKQSWLDANSFDLDTWRLGGEPEPTIVLVRNEVEDLSLFWNLRMLKDHDAASWIVPVPIDRCRDESVFSSLRRWLGRFDKTSNYCVVTSQSVAEADCCEFGERLRTVLLDTSIKYVDYEPPKNRITTVVPYESQLTWPAEIDGRTLQFVPPSPKKLSGNSSSEYWYVDLLYDAGTRRALHDIVLPPLHFVPEILNGPCPPTITHSHILEFGDGPDAINVRCSTQKNAVRFYVPRPEEVLEEAMISGGYGVVKDEKRASYLPTIERFGSIHQTAAAFTGKSAEILHALKNGPILPNTIRGSCKLGAGDLPIDDYLARIGQSLKHTSERIQRIAERRFREHALDEVPASPNLSSLLEYWADRRIARRSWELGPCVLCGQRWFTEHVDIQKPLNCPNCGRRKLLPESVRIGYSLSPSVKHAFDEGILPVVLTGRFLKNLTHRGFFWLPGVKYQAGAAYGDVDIIACCDGTIALAECKNLEGTPTDAPVWGEVLEQFLALSRVALNCKAGLVVLSSLAMSYPEELTRRIAEVLDGQIAYLLLTKLDLELGHRKEGGHRWVTIGDFHEDKFPEHHIVRTGDGRQLNLGAMVYTKGN